MDDERELLKDTLRSAFEESFNERLDRYFAVNHQRIIGNHYFAHASACIEAEFNWNRRGLFCVRVVAGVRVAKNNKEQQR